MEPQKFNAILNRARNEALRRRNLYMTTEHLLWSLLHEGELKRFLRSFDISDVEPLMRELGYYLDTQLEVESNPDVSDEELAVMTPGLEQVIFATMAHCVSAQVRFPRVLDLVIELIEADDESDSFSKQILEAHGITSLDLKKWAAAHPVRDNGRKTREIEIEGPIELESLRSELARDFNRLMSGNNVEFLHKIEEVEQNGLSEEDEALENEDWNDPGTWKAAIAKLGGVLRDLTERAERGELDPVIGREDEIHACIQTLLRRNKRNILIVGESGIGKTAIVYGLAERLASNQVPMPLLGYKIFELDVTALMAGTQFRGELENRIRHISDLMRRIPKSILFIDEIQVTSQSSGSHGEPSILSYLKPGLSDGTLRVIGTTTQSDGRNTLMSDNAIMRRFYKLPISAPDMELTKQIMMGVRDKYECYHEVEITDDAVEAAIELCDKYVNDRNFPDKALDVIDEAGARNRALPVSEQKMSIKREEVEEVVAKIANIPDIRASQDERQSLRDADMRLKKVIFGQDAAIETVMRLIKLSRAGLRPVDKPVASLLFAGPTGVGKTEIARQLAKILELSFVRFDMSEFQEAYTVSKFIGSAPGYVGYEKGGLLTEAIKSHPRCVLLLDEIEKAHPSIFDLLLQVMDAARLTDNSGNVADFKNVVLIMTSNAGGREMGQLSIGFSQKLDLSRSEKEIEKTFSPEFRNRLDEVIMFNPLERSVMERIVDKLVGELGTRLSSLGIRIKLSMEAREWLSERGFSELLGARPLARLIQKEISFSLSDEILFGALNEGGTCEVVVKEGGEGLAFKVEGSVLMK